MVFTIVSYTCLGKLEMNREFGEALEKKLVGRLSKRGELTLTPRIL
jgi:hypothetical protein